MSDVSTDKLETRRDAAEGTTAHPVVAYWKSAFGKVDDSQREKDWRRQSERIVGIYEAEGEDKRYNVLYSNTETITAAVWSGSSSADVRGRPRERDLLDPAAEGPGGPVAPDPVPAAAATPPAGPAPLPGNPMPGNPMAGGDPQAALLVARQAAERAERRLVRGSARILQRGINFVRDQHDLDDEIGNAVVDYALTGRGSARVRYVPQTQEVPLRVDLVARYDSEAGVPDAAGQPMPRFYRPGVEAEVTEYQQDEGGAFVMDSRTEVLSQSVWLEHMVWDTLTLLPARSWRKVPAARIVHHMTRDERVAQFGPVGGKVPNDHVEVGDQKKDGDSKPLAAEALETAEVWEIWDKAKRQLVFLAPRYPDAPLLVLDDPLKLKGFFPFPRPLYALRSRKDMTPVPEYRIYEDQAREVNHLTLRIRRVMEAIEFKGVFNKALGETLQEMLRNAKTGDLVPAEMSEINMNLDQQIWLMPIDKLVNELQQLMLNREAVKQEIAEIIGMADIMRGSVRASESATATQAKDMWGSLRIDKRRRAVARFVRDCYRLIAEIIAEHFEPRFLEAMAGVPVTPEIMGLLRDDLTRRFLIDVESQASGAVESEQEKRDTVDAANAITQFIGQVAPIVQSGALSMDVARALLLTFLRRFRMGREVEEALEQLGAAVQQGQQDQAAAAEAQAAQAQVAAEVETAQAKAQVDQARAQADMARLAREEELATVQHSQRMAELEREEELALLRQDLERSRILAAARQADATAPAQ